MIAAISSSLWETYLGSFSISPTASQNSDEISTGFFESLESFLWTKEALSSLALSMKSFFLIHREPLQMALQNKGFTEVNTEDVKDCNFMLHGRSFKSLLEHSPYLVIQASSLGMHLSLEEKTSFNLGFKSFSISFVNFIPLTPLRSLKSNVVGKFMSIRGNVIRTSEIKPLVTEMEFSCSQCGCFFTQLFPDGRFNPPTSCKNTNCESRKFAPQRSKHGTTNWQRIRVQELPDSDNIELGSIPRTIDCELTSSLVDSSSVGHIVNLCGVLKAVKSDQIEQKSFKKRKRDSYQCTFELYLEVHSVRNENETNNNMGISEFSLLDLHMMRTVKSTPHLFSFVVNSLCPSIFGNEIIKAGLCLSLFGGCVARFDSEKSSPARGDIHVLVVGDPGLGKSQMMKAAVHAAPKGFFVSGNSTSNSGLTVTMVREGGDFVLEAGALVLADQGICCIDEFDKMNADYQSLLEVMEQQTISIAKAGMICSLSARCSIIAAANPIGGHYNSSKTVQENLKLSPALLSRFDLIFILLDCPDEHRDMLLSDHVIRVSFQVL